MFNMLIDSLVPVTSHGTRIVLTLPELFSRLAGNSVDDFPGLAAHQHQAWYQFLAQLGAIALHRAGRHRLPEDPEQWQVLLTALTPDCAETAWSLVVEEPTSTALLQPPTRKIDAFTRAAETADALDVLVTAKNHDRKQAQAVGCAPHLWLYALVTLQTTQGYSGRGNPGIARMNGGLSSRVLVDRRPGPRWGPRVDRATRMLLTRRPDLQRRLSDDLYRFDGGLALTWLVPWDTDTPLRMAELDPFFIEVCRRVRLTATTTGRIAALGRPANAQRVYAQAWKGNLGDPWVPINLGKSDPSALTVSGNGFDYRLAQRILLDPQAMKPPLALKALPGEEDEDSEIHMTVLVRGQGKTEGLHERIVPLPRSIAAQLPFEDDDIPTLANLSESMVELAGEARKVLRQAVLVYLQGPEAPNFQKRDATTIVARYDRTIDAQFFHRLFAASEIGTDEVIEDWQRFLRDEAVKLAEKFVWDRMVPPSTRREKALAASEAVLFGGLRKRLPDAFPEHDAKEVVT